MVDQVAILPDPVHDLSIGADVRTGIIRRRRGDPAGRRPFPHALERLHRDFHVAGMRHPGRVDDWTVVGVVGGDGHVAAREGRHEARAQGDVVVCRGDVVRDGAVG